MIRNKSQLVTNWRGFSVKLGFELIVIVAGILIALAINEWQTGRENRELEQEYIRRLIADMESNLFQAEYRIRWQQSIVENARRILPLAKSGTDPDLEPSHVVAAAYWASAITSPNWNAATHQELVSSGSYVILENPDLRGELLRFYEQTVPNRQMFDLASTEYREAIRSEFDPELQIAIRQNCDRLEDLCDLDAFESAIDQHISWMRNNGELAKKLGRVIPQSERGVEYAKGIKESTEALIALLEAELEVE